MVTQLSVLDPPTVIVDGEAVKESIRHGEPGQLIVVGEEYAVCRTAIRSDPVR